MERLIINVNNHSNAELLMRIAKSLDFVTSISIEKSTNTSAASVIEWIKPGKPATDEEVELLLAESEKGTAISAKKSKENNLKKFKAWKQKTLK